MITARAAGLFVPLLELALDAEGDLGDRARAGQGDVLFSFVFELLKEGAKFLFDFGQGDHFLPGSLGDLGR